MRFRAAGAAEAGRSANISLVAFVTAALDWRFTSAVMRMRAVLATEFAPLNHMLMNGFFFNHGLDMRLRGLPCRLRAGHLEAIDRGDDVVDRRVMDHVPGAGHDRERAAGDLSMQPRRMRFRVDHLVVCATIATGMRSSW